MNKAGSRERREPVPGAPHAVTVITGASRGIGLALAREFAGAGHDLLIVARSEEDLKPAADDLRAAYRVDVHWVAADLGTPEGCRRLADAIAEKGLYADYLVNNAAFGLAGRFDELDRERTLTMLDLNVRAVTDLSRRFLPAMIARGAGGILNVSSLGGISPGPYTSAYYASKAYVTSLTEALAEEARGTGVRIAVLAPGPVATDFHRRQGSQGGYYIKFLGLMQAEDVARVAFKAFMRGRTFIVPGWMNLVCAVFTRLTPHFILVPFTGWLLKPRGGAT